MPQPLKLYLAAYNLTAFLFWGIYLFTFLSEGLVISTYSLLLLNIAQGLALLEIVHSQLKWVKSPVGSTVAQVSSRLLVLVLINAFTKEDSLSSFINKGIFICSFAWSITELVRYSFYFLSLFTLQLKPLSWMRYTFFIILYPLGVIGEWLILASPVTVNGFSFSGYTVFLVLALVAYTYYFPILYKYMWKQRKLKIT